MTQATIGLLYAALTGVCWALLAIGLKYALHFTSTGTIVWIRMIVAFGILFLIYAARYPKTLKTIFINPPWRILVAGVFLAINYFAYMKGLELTSASNAQIMIQLGPLSLLFIGVLYFKEKILPMQWIGIAIAFMGFIFFNWDQFRAALEKSDIYITGNLWLLFAAATWAAFAGLQKYQLLRGWTPQMVNLLVYGVCCLALYPTANVAELAPLSFWQWTVLATLGINTLIAYGAFGEALHRAPTSQVSLVISVNPLLTIFLMEIFLRMGVTFVSPEPIMWRGYLGAFLVVAGVAMAVSLKPKR